VRHAADLPQALARLDGARQRVEQAARVRVRRGVQHLRHRAGLHDPARVHHGHLVGQLGDHAQVVRDPDQRRAVGAADLLHAVQDLALDGHVQCRGGFVTDDQLGLVEHRNGNRHALAHAARKFVRVVAQPRGRGRYADHFERLHAALQGGGARNLGVVRLDGFQHLLLDAQHRVERHQRVLKDHRDAVATQLAHLLFVQVAQVPALEQHLARDHFAGRVDQAEDGKTGDGLARTGFADQAHDLAGLDGQVHPAHGGPGAVLGVENRVQAAHFQQWCRCHHQPLGSSAARRRSAITLIARIRSSSARPGNMLIQ
jgi:hypothetical protein